jgi:hypothetical protein
MSGICQDPVNPVTETSGDSLILAVMAAGLEGVCPDFLFPENWLF